MKKDQLKDLFDRWQANLPPAFGRTSIDQLFPGIITSKTIANLDSLGLGPKGRYTQGRKVLYEKEAFLDWLRDRIRQVN